MHIPALLWEGPHDVPSARLIGVKSRSSRVLMPNFRATRPSLLRWGAYLQNKRAMAVPHLFRNKPYSRRLGQTELYCLQTRMPRFTRAWSFGPGLPKLRSPPRYSDSAQGETYSGSYCAPLSLDIDQTTKCHDLHVAANPPAPGEWAPTPGT